MRLVESLEFANENLDVDAFSRTLRSASDCSSLGLMFVVRRTLTGGWALPLRQSRLWLTIGVSITICFLNEVTGSARLVASWLVSTSQTQAERLMGRDGLTVDPAAGQHPSETVLDDYEGFHVRVSNDGPIEEPVSAILAGISIEKT